MKTTIRYQIVLTVVILLLIAGCTSDSGNWPQFRGPDYNMVLTEIDLPASWAEDQNIRWTYKLNGVSWSSPIIWGDKVFISTSFAEKNLSGLGTGVFIPRPPAPPDTNAVARTQQRAQPPSQPPSNQEEEDKSYLNDVFRLELVCLDVNTGKELWKQIAYKGNPRIKTHVGNTYASETPVTDGNRVYVYFGMTGVFCYSLEGQLIWQKDLGTYDTQRGWGTGSSPLVYEDILYVQIDNEVNSFLVALDAENGEELWRVSRAEKTNYSTPIIWKNSIRVELITGGKIARSYDPKTGELLWQLNMGGEMNIPSPVPDKDRLYLGNAGGREVKGTLFSVMAGVNGDITPEEGETTSNGVEWAITEAGMGNASPLIYNGLIYVLGSRGGLQCYEASSGKLLYDEKIKKVRASWATPWAYDGKIHVLDDRGITHVIKAGEQYELLSQNELDDTFWASPAFFNNLSVFKGARKLYCIGM